MARSREQHESYFGKLKDEARKHANDTPIDPRWLCNALSEALPENAVISEETTVYRSLIQEAIPRTRPQSYFARITGGLGVGLSYALAYYPDQRDGKTHELRVQTSRPGVRLRASRTSYLAPAP